MPQAKVFEPLALAALAASAVALHAIWIVNLLAHRITPISHWLTLVPQLGPVLGLYLIAAVAYLVVFIAVGLFYRGRDCSHVRDGFFWFFVSALIAFAILTLPFVAGFSQSV